VAADRFQRLEEAIARVAEAEEAFLAFREGLSTQFDMQGFQCGYNNVQLARDEFKKALETLGH